MTATIDLQAIASELFPKFAERTEAHDAADRFCAENYDELKARRVFSALVPAAYGGGGASHAQMCDFLRTMAHHCPSTALALSMHQHIVAAALANDMAGRPGKAVLEKVGAAEAVLVSTGANDWLESNGSARRTDGGYLVSAVKPFASGSPKGDMIVTSAVWQDAPEGPQVLHFPVPLGAQGVSFMDDWEALGMRCTGSQTVRLDNVFVPDAAVSIKRPRGPYHMAFSVILTAALPLIMSAYVGTAEAAVNRALGKVRDSEDHVQQILAGELVSHLSAAQIAHSDMVRLANGLDFNPTPALASAMLVRKTLCANNAISTTEKAMELAGGNGFMRKSGIERLLRDVHGAQFHPLPEKRQQAYTGRVALGLPPVAIPQDSANDGQARQGARELAGA